MLGTNGNETYFDNMPIGCNLDELVGEDELMEIQKQEIRNSFDFS